MLIDTHCHLDAAAFESNRAEVILECNKINLKMIVVPAISMQNLAKVKQLSQEYPQCCYALGLHPMEIDHASPSDITKLSAVLTQTLKEKNKLVAIGEIGLDFFVTKANREVQEYFFSEQLKLAKKFNLPVILHVRRAVDEVLKHLRQYQVCGGIAHAFNGSQQQAKEFIKLGFKLGFGGAMTYPRALKIRELAETLPLDAIVLETDAPDMPPVWLSKGVKNGPQELLNIANILADIRRMSVSQIIEITGKNSQQVLPNLATLCTPLQVKP